MKDKIKIGEYILTKRFGMKGIITNVFPNFKGIPAEICGGNKDDWFKKMNARMEMPLRWKSKGRWYEVKMQAGGIALVHQEGVDVVFGKNDLSAVTERMIASAIRSFYKDNVYEAPKGSEVTELASFLSEYMIDKARSTEGKPRSVNDDSFDNDCLK